MSVEWLGQAEVRRVGYCPSGAYSKAYEDCQLLAAKAASEACANYPEPHRAYCFQWNYEFYLGPAQMDCGRHCALRQIQNLPVVRIPNFPRSR